MAGLWGMRNREKAVGLMPPTLTIEQGLRYQLLVVPSAVSAQALLPHREGAGVQS